MTRSRRINTDWRHSELRTLPKFWHSPTWGCIRCLRDGVLATPSLQQAPANRRQFGLRSPWLCPHRKASRSQTAIKAFGGHPDHKQVAHRPIGSTRLILLQLALGIVKQRQISARKQRRAKTGTSASNPNSLRSLGPISTITKTKTKNSPPARSTMTRPYRSAK